jgi:hypothetical protein
MFDEINVWTPVPEYVGFYEVTKTGKLRSLHPKEGPKMVKARVDWGGYLAVVLCKGGNPKTMRVHRVVALTFVPNPAQKLFVNHLDGDKLNNCVDNLEWVTHSENLKHAYAKGLIKKGSKRVRDLCSGELFKNVKEASMTLGIAYSTLKAYLVGTRPNKTCLTYEN